MGARAACARLSRSDVEHAFNEGHILRTHVLRPTWHFVTPADIRWMLALSSPRVHATNAYYYRQSGLDAKVFARVRDDPSRARGRRADDARRAGRALKRAKVPADGLKLAYLMMHAELEGVICSGPRRDKEFTYALLDNALRRGRPSIAVTRWPSWPSVISSARTGHHERFRLVVGVDRQGREARHRGGDAETRQETIDGRRHWRAKRVATAPIKGCTALLLPNYDES